MQVITNLRYKEEHHTLVDFLKTQNKPFIINLMDPRQVVKTLNGKKIYESAEVLLKHRWTAMRTGKGMNVGQLVAVKLADNAWVHIYLLTQGEGDKAVIYITGQHKEVNYFDIAYAGPETIFKDHLKKMGISELEALLGQYHLEYDEDDESYADANAPDE